MMSIIRRNHHPTLALQYDGKNIADVIAMLNNEHLLDNMATNQSGDVMVTTHSDAWSNVSAPRDSESVRQWREESDRVDDIHAAAKRLHLASIAILGFLVLQVWL